jgi:hypothetical protein
MEGAFMRTAVAVVCSLVLAGTSIAVTGADSKSPSTAADTQQVAYTAAPSTTSRAKPADQLSPLVFAAPPRETPDKGEEIYKPIAAYLSQALGRKVEYQHPGTWGVYRTEMLRGAYDIIFDGPHFNSYRAEKLNHNIVAKIPKRHEFVIIVRKDSKFASVKDLIGRTFCAHAPPNLGTLVLLDQFDNPARQPVILNTKGWNEIYSGVVSGQCVAGILPILNLQKSDSAGHAKVLYKAKVLPNQAFSVGPRLNTAEQEKIARALVAPEAKEPTAKLRAAYKVGDAFSAANNEEYRGLSVFLRNEWGYY